MISNVTFTQATRMMRETRSRSHEEPSEINYYDVGTITREEGESTIILKASGIQRMGYNRDEDHRGRAASQL